MRRTTKVDHVESRESGRISYARMEVLTACRTAKCLEMKNHNEMVMSCPLISRNRPESEIKF